MEYVETMADSVTEWIEDWREDAAELITGDDDHLKDLNHDVYKNLSTIADRDQAVIASSIYLQFKWKSGMFPTSATRRRPFLLSDKVYIGIEISHWV